MTTQKLVEALRECAVIRAAISHDDEMRALVRLQRGEMAIKDALHKAEQAAEAQPVAFVHWPMSGAPRLVWYSNKALEDATRKECDGHQPDLLLYTRPQQPLTVDQLDELRQTDNGALSYVTLRQLREIARAVERAHGITKDTKDTNT